MNSELYDTALCKIKHGYSMEEINRWLSEQARRKNISWLEASAVFQRVREEALLR